MTSQRSTSTKTSAPAMTSSGKASEMTALQFISQDELVRLFEEQKGAQYFIPDGFEPVLIPRGFNLQPIEALKGLQQQIILQKQQQKIQQTTAQGVANVNSTASTLTKNNNNNNNNSTSDVRFPQLVLARAAAAQTPRGGVVAKTKQKKPPRPPNAFILYRRSKQSDIVAANEGITNNEVSKQIGEMWHRESAAEKQKFQLLADQAKIEHLKKFPDYKYRPRRPHEKRRRTKRPSASLGNSNAMSSAVASSAANPTKGTSPMMNGGNFADINESLLRRSSIDTTCSFDDSRRNSLLSTGDANEFNDFEESELNDLEELGYDQMNIFDTSVSPMVDETTFQYHQISPEEYNNTCVETAALNILTMEGVSPSSETEVNPFEYYDLYSGGNYDYLSSLNSFGLNPYVSLPDGGMINLPEMDS
ncbi:18811_t:CDS:1 [Acaulospora morrowiae]|uniref:18811_t:CDS:1 n=1 Tax=Acaulospora morrowiae TaxID=94023 RepID=A0A9N8W6U5_9GLOM|nr:18811_t:CDS:1 [Acaulospora morrowiae]